MRLVKVGKHAGANEYDVYSDSVLIGNLYRNKYLGLGEREWVLYSFDDKSAQRFDSFKEAKAHIAATERQESEGDDGSN